jgi:hypothetical protein
MVLIPRPKLPHERNALAEMFSTEELEFLQVCVTPGSPSVLHEKVYERIRQALAFRREQEGPKTSVTGFWLRGQAIVWDATTIYVDGTEEFYTGRVPTPYRMPPASDSAFAGSGLTKQDAWDLFKRDMLDKFPGATLHLFYADTLPAPMEGAAILSPAGDHLVEGSPAPYPFDVRDTQDNGPEVLADALRVARRHSPGEPEGPKKND